MDQWMNFHFDCINPFISCRDLVALSWCCKYFYNECNLKRTLYRKFRTEVSRVIFSRERPQWVNVVCNGLTEHNGVISGGSMLAVFCQLPHYGDVDIFYQSSVPDSFGLYSPNSHAKIINEGGNPVEYQTMQHVSGQFIKDIVDVETPETSTTWQFINTDKDFIIPKLSRVIRSRQDHVIGIIDATFDLEFCKITYCPQKLEISNLSSVINQRSAKTFSHKLDDLTVSNWRDVPIINKKLGDRAQKYIDRGFCIINHDELLQVIRIGDVLNIVIRYEQFMKIYNRRKIEKDKKQQIEKDKKQKESQQFVQKLINGMAEDPWINREECDHINFNQQYVPLVEWVSQYTIPPELVYKVLRYGSRTDFIKLCFDVQKIPRRWMKQEEYYARVYFYSVFHGRISESVFTNYFWKLVYTQWPTPCLKIDPTDLNSRSFSSLFITSFQKFMLK